MIVEAHSGPDFGTTQNRLPRGQAPYQGTQPFLSRWAEAFHLRIMIGGRPASVLSKRKALHRPEQHTLPGPCRAAAFNRRDIGHASVPSLGASWDLAPLRRRFGGALSRRVP